MEYVVFEDHIVIYSLRILDKVAYLKAAPKSKESQNLIEEEAKAHSYSSIMKRLEARYYKPRKAFRQIVQGLFTSRLPSELGKAAEIFHTHVMGVVNPIIMNDYSTI